jgi:hypothetical protein
MSPVTIREQLMAGIVNTFRQKKNNRIAGDVNEAACRKRLAASGLIKSE